MVDFRTMNGRGEFYFIRHGVSQGNDAGIIQGRHDYPLSADGQAQALSTAHWFKDKNIACILTSPLQRARETAEIMAGELGLGPVRVDENLNELDTGLFTGMTPAECRDRYPEEWKSFQRLSWDGVTGAESIEDLCLRAAAFWQTLAGLYRGGKKNLLAVTHSGILQWVVKVTFGQKDWMPLVPMSNCCINQFTLDNNLESEIVRYYYLWTRLNSHPFPDDAVFFS